MDAAPPPAPPQSSPVNPTWPRSAQLAAAALLGGALALLGANVWGYAGWANRPTELRPGRVRAVDLNGAEPAPYRPKEVRPAGAINVNTASAAELRQLRGIGPKLSQAIIDERERAPFKSVDELRRVHGIGAKTLDRLRPYVTVGREAVSVASSD